MKKSTKEHNGLFNLGRYIVSGTRHYRPMKWTVRPLEEQRVRLPRHSIIEVVEIPSGLLRRHLRRGARGGVRLTGNNNVNVYYNARFIGDSHLRSAQRVKLARAY